MSAARQECLREIVGSCIRRHVSELASAAQSSNAQQIVMPVCQVWQVHIVDVLRDAHQLLHQRNGAYDAMLWQPSAQIGRCLKHQDLWA